jgi:signal transduction histidine kinase/integral membrane sensor domain MASE1/ActR/RegA family two-component response regulator
VRATGVKTARVGVHSNSAAKLRSERGSPAVGDPAGFSAGRRVGLGVAIAVAYVLAAHLGFRFAFVAEQVTTVWAPTGIGIAALLIGGLSMAPAVWVGAFLSNASFDGPLWAAAAIATGNMLEAVVAAALLGRLPRFDRHLHKLHDALAFVVAAGGAATAVSATVGVTTLCAAGIQPWSRFGDLWRAWWLGDAVGALIVAPVILTASLWHRRPRRYLIESAAIVASAAIATQIVFGLVSGGMYHPLEFAIFPFVIAGAMRGGLPLSAVVALVASIVSIGNTARGAGPFASPQVHDSLILLQVFMGVLAGTGLLLSAAIAERETGERRRMAAARVGEILGTARDLQSATRPVIEAICTALHWQVGVVWRLDEERQHLRCTDAWTEPGLEASPFVKRTREIVFERGVGLPGRIWHSRQPAWIVNVVTDTNFPRADVARAANLHGAFGFPILLDDEFLGVIEFFNRTIVPPDPDLLQTMSTVGSQFGQFIGRKREEAAARQAEGERERLLAREAAARSDAEAANRAKDEFLATLSHELRTPLNAIVGWTRILQEGLLDPAGTRHALEVIERNAHLQAQLVADILDVSRIVSGKVRLDLRPVELGAILGAALDAVRPAAAARQVRLEAALGTGPRIVMGDPERLQQVIWNLLSNAVKFSAVGGKVEVELDAAGDKVARIRVADHGIGIEADFLPHVFERFRQADGSMSRPHGGLGLGLAIVHHLVELHGGRVRAESEGRGRGAVFTVELPVAVTPSAARELTSLDTEIATDILRGLRLLVVEDHEDSRELMAAMLAGTGATVDLAGSARDALRLLDTEWPDVLLSDIAMPNGDGFELIREIRRRESSAGGHLPAVAVTAHAAPSDRDAAIAAGFDHHLPKPVSREALVATVLAMSHRKTRKR